MPEGPVVLVFNPVAGAGRAARTAARTAAALGRLGLPARMEATQGPGGGALVAARWQDRCRALLAVGGDGSMRDLLQGLADLAMPVGLVPAGTGNVLALELGLPRDPEAAARLVAAGTVRRLDVMEVRREGEPPRRCLLFAGAGLDGQVVAAVAAARDRRLAAGGAGHLALASYLWPGLLAWSRWRPRPLEIAVDGASLPGGPWGQVLVASAGSYARLLALGRQVRPDDGALDLFALAGGRFTLLRFALRGLLGLEGPMRGLRHARLQEAAVAGEAGVPVQLDGDPGGLTPFSVRRLETAAAVLAPPRREEGKE